MITSDTLYVFGYKLFANTGRDDDLRLVYDGGFNAQITSFLYD